MGYSNNPAMCRVDLFKESGKWYETVAVNFSFADWSEDHPADALTKAMEKFVEQNVRNGGGRYSGMTAVCLHPYVKYEFPVMIVLP